MKRLLDEIKSLKERAKGTKLEDEFLTIHKAQLIYMKLYKAMSHKQIAYALNTEKATVDNIMSSKRTRPGDLIITRLEKIFFNRLGIIGFEVENDTFSI